MKRILRNKLNDVLDKNMYERLQSQLGDKLSRELNNRISSANNMSLIMDVLVINIASTINIDLRNEINII